MSVETSTGHRGARSAAGALLFLLVAVSAPVPVPVTRPPAAPTCHVNCGQSHFEATNPTNPTA
jgi:hypothetical protein